MVQRLASPAPQTPLGIAWEAFHDGQSCPARNAELHIHFLGLGGAHPWRM
jgi:hypothetical protein